MKNNSGNYGPGDWLVHHIYGLGQIRCVEEKAISGEAKPYFRIETADSIYWAPVDQTDDEMMRPLSTREEIEEALAALRRPPRQMASNHTQRQGRIKLVRDKFQPLDMARLIRDLRARRKAKGGLNMTERRALRTLSQHFAEEWAAVMDIHIDNAVQQLSSLLRPEDSDLSEHGASLTTSRTPVTERESPSQESQVPFPAQSSVTKLNL